MHPQAEERGNFSLAEPGARKHKLRQIAVHPSIVQNDAALVAYPQAVSERVGPDRWAPDIDRTWCGFDTLAPAALKSDWKGMVHANFPI